MQSFVEAILLGAPLTQLPVTHEKDGVLESDIDLPVGLIYLYEVCVDVFIGQVLFSEM